MFYEAALVVKNVLPHGEVVIGKLFAAVAIILW